MKVQPDAHLRKQIRSGGRVLGTLSGASSSASAASEGLCEQTRSFGLFMNKSYRSIWNESLGAWVAASEITSARGKRSKGVQNAGSSRGSSARSLMKLSAGFAVGVHLFLIGPDARL